MTADRLTRTNREGQVEHIQLKTQTCTRTLSLDVRNIQSILHSKDHHSKKQVKGIAGTQNRKSTFILIQNNTFHTSQLSLYKKCKWKTSIAKALQSLLYSVDINLHISHVAIAPVVFETHDQCVGLQTTQSDSLKTTGQTYKSAF